MLPFSIATNVSLSDDVRIRLTVPSWLRVFGSQVTEIVIIVDEQPATGRIARLHSGSAGLDSVYMELEKLKRSDSRIRYATLPSQAGLSSVCSKWFRRATPMRCQAGTPILAFIFGIEEASSDLVLRTDCDMLFCDRGWVRKALDALDSGNADIVEPPRLGSPKQNSPIMVSSRAFLLQREYFARNCLPINPHRLDLLRRVHRFINGRPPWLALEQMLQIEREAGHLRHLLIGPESGFSMHIPTRADASIAGFEKICAAVETDNIPEAQLRAGWNFVRNAWSEVL
jgi:hypothetical protein